MVASGGTSRDSDDLRRLALLERLVARLEGARLDRHGLEHEVPKPEASHDRPQDARQIREFGWRDETRLGELMDLLVQLDTTSPCGEH
jgi:hypothetical protein